MNLRTIAARVVFQVVFRGNSLSDSLPEALATIPEPRDQALVQAICYGVCRHYFFLEALTHTLLEKGLNERDQDVFALLLVGLYQLKDMRIPAYAAVAETVSAVNDLQKTWAKGLVNAVLRNYQRRADELHRQLAADPLVDFEHPAWMIGKIKKAWPTHWETILDANNEHPPFALRVNQQRQSREEYLNFLAASDIEAMAIPETSCGILLQEPMDVEALPGFAAGDVSVQDGAAQLAAELLELSPGQRVLDACAAPGGKTAHILEQQPDLGELVAIDKDKNRLCSVTENLQRLHLTATCLPGDAAEPDTWWDKKLFDRILLDAPCSASGVIRRHPDIKLLRRPEDIQSMAALQWRLLTALWQLLKIDGILVYSTCSIFPEENVKILNRFFAEHPEAQEHKIEAQWGEACEIGRQIFPGMHSMDGFYYARLRKSASHSHDASTRAVKEG
jgi:16S rRNA (cytosine967-C5)-methyltransferase